MRGGRQWAVAVAVGASLIGFGSVSAQDGRRTIEVTISLGVAEMVESVEDADTLVARADRALYAAKREGRDRVARFGDPPRTPARRRARPRAA